MAESQVSRCRLQKVSIGLRTSATFAKTQHAPLTYKILEGVTNEPKGV
jgi:hypothetical protein